MVYKLVELDGLGKIKLSPGKKTYPMAKQVFRRRDRSDRFCGDHVTRADESAEGEPLLVPILQAGRLVAALPSLESIRNHCRQQLRSRATALWTQSPTIRSLTASSEATHGGCSDMTRE